MKYTLPTSKDKPKYIQEKFEGIAGELKNKNCIITGDFNYNLFNLKYHEETENLYNIITYTIMTMILCVVLTNITEYE